MATGKALNGKPYAGNPHVRFDEGEVASCTAEASLRRVHCRRQPEGRASVCAVTPRRGSLLYKNMFLNAAVAACCVALAFAPARSEPSKLDPKGSSCLSGTNLIVNGTFESGEFSPWTRNDTKGKANKQGRVSVYAAGGNSWVDGALGGKALVVQSFNNRDKVWLDSTDSYALQSFKVDEPGKYRLSFDYAGRGHRDDKYWVRASCRVRVLHGADATGKSIYAGSFSPVTKATYTRYSEVVDIVEAGVYSLQFLVPQPVGTEPESCDKCVVIDNVCFVHDGGRGATDMAFEPDGARDRTAEVLAAIENGATLRFSKGEYHFRSPTKLYYYISNHDNPQPHSVFLPIRNVTDMTMRGDGAVFVFHGSGVGLTLMDTRRVTVRGIAFDWARPAFTEAKVAEVDGGNVVLRPDQEHFPLAVEGGRLIAVGEGWRNHVPIIEAFDGDTLDPVLGISYMGGATALAGGTIRLDARKALRRAFRPLRAGDIALIRSPFRPSPGVSLYRAHDTILEDCTIHGGDGMGLVAQRCENVTVRGSGKASDRTAGAFAREGGGYATALQADATHFSNCKGLVLVENCLFEATVDDAINVHSTCLRIESVPKPDTLVCRYMHKQSTGFEVFLPGERLRFIKAETLEPGAETVVKDAAITDPLHVTLTLDAPVPQGYAPGDAVENADWQPAVVFRNNIARKICARAVLLTTPGKTVVEGNIFEKVSSQVIQLEGDASGWYESGACRDVTIRNNVFRNCAFMRGEGIIQIRPNLKDLKSQKERYHRNIVIERNRFETPRIPLLRACSVSNLVWRGNEVIYNNSFPARGNRPFVIDYSGDVVTNLSGVVRLPGTLADAKLGRVMTIIAGEDEDAAATVARPGAVKKTVAFLGGSITEMAGFRPRVMKALRAKYPQVDFVEIAAGLASTCSDAGAFRLEEDVLSRGVPDLFIVEAAVNDDQDGHFTQEHSIRGMEGAVRHVLACNPSCAVVVALMVNRSQYRTLMEGGTPEHYAAHAKVAKHYGAALADVGSALAASAKSGGMSWSEYRNCHPSAAGCDLGAKVVMDAIARVFDPLARLVEARALPPPLDAKSYFNGRFLPLGAVRLGDGWNVSRPDWDSIPGSKRSYFTQGPTIWSERAGSELSFSFKGNAAGIFLTAGPDAGDIEVSVDGGAFRKERLKANYGSLHYPYVHIVADGLADGTHAVRLRVVPAARGKGAVGTAVRIHRICVN